MTNTPKTCAICHTPQENGDDVVVYDHAHHFHPDKNLFICKTCFNSEDMDAVYQRCDTCNRWIATPDTTRQWDGIIVCDQCLTKRHARITTETDRVSIKHQPIESRIAAVSDLLNTYASSAGDLETPVQLRSIDAIATAINIPIIEVRDILYAIFVAQRLSPLINIDPTTPHHISIDRPSFAEQALSSEDAAIIDAWQHGVTYQPKKIPTSALELITVNPADRTFIYSLSYEGRFRAQSILSSMAQTTMQHIDSCRTAYNQNIEHADHHVSSHRALPEDTEWRDYQQYLLERDNPDHRSLTHDPITPQQANAIQSTKPAAQKRPKKQNSPEIWEWKHET